VLYLRLPIAAEPVAQADSLRPIVNPNSSQAISLRHWFRQLRKLVGQACGRSEL